MLWVDGAKVTDVTDTRAAETVGTVPGLDVFGSPGAGAVTVKELSYYEHAQERRAATPAA